jgi:hypothetical protein
MANSSQQPLPPSGGRAARHSRTGNAGNAAVPSRALLVTLAIAVADALLGLAGGLIWSAVAPQAVFQVQGPGVAYVVNPETTAFIAADGYFSLIAVIGGVIIGLAAYLFGVRRYGPVPVLGALAGATAAAFLAWWSGSNLGLSSFRHQLGTSKNGALLRQPVDLGAHGALAFWPLAAGGVIGGIELMLLLRERQRAVAQPAGTAPPPPPPSPFPPGPFRTGNLQPDNFQPGNLQPGNLQPDHFEPGQFEPGQTQPGQTQPGPAQRRDLNGQSDWRQPDWSWDQPDR